MKVDLLVDFAAFWTRLAEDIRAAERQVLVQTFSFEGDCIGKALAHALVGSGAQDKRILVDSFSRLVLSDRFLFAPGNWFNAELCEEQRETKRLHASLCGNGIQVKYGNPFGPTPRRFLTRNHKKLVVIDDRISYIGGMNFSEHNAAWHDLMLRIENEDVAVFFCEDFIASWEGQNSGRTKGFDGLGLSTLDGRSNSVAFRKVLDLIDGARKSVFIVSPYVTFPFYEHLRDARRRGVPVTIVTPKSNNWSCFADYAKWESARCGIDLRLYQKGMSHLKAMLVDDECLVVGSSNFDLLSYRLYQEILAIVTDSDVITAFREQVLAEDLRNSEGVDEQTA